MAEEKNEKVIEAPVEKKEEIKIEKVEKKEEKQEAKPAPKAEKTKKKKKRSKTKGIFAKAKKKTAVARARIKRGKGRITINRRLIDLVQPRYVHDFIKEPLQLVDKAELEGVDISVNVTGGGYMGQAVAARSAIAKSLADYTNNKKLKEAFIKYDRLLLVDDSRRSEAKKPLGRGARAKKQQSKR